MQSIDSREIASPWLTKDFPKSESHFERETVMETDDNLHRPNLCFMQESASEPTHGQFGLQRNVEDVIIDQRPISFKYEAIANLNGDFKPDPNFEAYQSNISMKQTHTKVDICPAIENRSSHNNDQSMDMIEKDSGVYTVNSKPPIIIKEELTEVDEYSDDTQNHLSSNIEQCQLKIECVEMSDSLIHSPLTNQSEPSSCGNENNLTTVSTISTICKEELDLEDVQSVMVKEESHNVNEIDIKLEASLRDNLSKYSKSDNDDINSDSTCDNKTQQYMCHSCPRKFPTRPGFIDHLISHHAKIVVYKCLSCEISFTTKAALSEHSADSHSKPQVKEPNRPLVTIQFMSNNSVKVNKSKAQGQLVTCAYRCLICRKAFKAENLLRNHLEKAASCKKCLKLFCSPTELLIHNKVHGNDILFERSSCKRQFKNKGWFRIRISRKQVICGTCGKRFCGHVKFLEHKKKCWHWPMPAYLFSCNLCSKKFNTPEKLVNHMAGHSISCGLCSRKFVTSSSLLSHNKRDHKGILTETLRSEGANAVSLQTISYSSKMRNRTAKQSISCGLCPRKFLTPSGLLKHNETDHKDRPAKETVGSKGVNSISLESIRCPTKMTSFSQTGEFKNTYSHNESVSRKKVEGRSEGRSLRKFICQICKSEFDSEQKLKIHINKPQETCDTCGEKFCENIDIREHKEKLGHWPRRADYLISCKLCSQKFDTPKKLLNHFAEHSISCGLCPRTFLSSLDLLDHNKRDHKDNLPEETLGSKGVNAINFETVSCTTQIIDHTAEHSISCGLCPRKFLFSLDLLNHNKRDHKDSLPEDTLGSKGDNAISLETVSCTTQIIDHTAEESISCGPCPRKFLTSFSQAYEFQSTYSHKKSVSLKKVEGRSESRSLSKFDCRICRSKFDTPKKLRNHLRGSISCGPFPRTIRTSFSRSNEPNKFSVGLKKAEGRSEGRSLRKFDCKICKSEFDSDQKLKIHKNKPQETCDTCGEKFCENIDIREHKEKCWRWPSPGVLISCKLCSEKFSPTQMRIHMAEHSLSCGLYPQKFLTSSSLLNHNETDHKDQQHEGTLSAKVVKAIGAETFSCPTKMVDHSTEHWISCGLCPQKFLTSSSLLNHNETDHKDRLSDKLLKETVSAKGINAISLQTVSCPTVKIRNHGAEHLNSGVLSPQKFLTSSSLLNHNETDHKDNRPEDTLGSKGANSINLEANRTKCASNKILRQNHVCTEHICPDYYQHNRRRLSGCKLKLMFPCSSCSARFKSPEELSSHIRTKHSFSCTVCPERFSDPSDLLIHKYEAHSERRFVGCPFCSKKIVVRHFCKHSKKCRKRDKQIPRFKCVFCDKEFGSAKNLQLHRKKLCLKRYVLVGNTNSGMNEFDAVESTKSTRVT